MKRKSELKQVSNREKQISSRNLRLKPTLAPKVALHDPIIKEHLPWPIVHYSNFYGIFLAFSKTETDTPSLCACAEPAAINYLALRDPNPSLNSDPLRMAPFDSFDFPKALSQGSLKNTSDPIKTVEFYPNICHRCNMATPSLLYCSPLYGGRFQQCYGWYINQTRLRMGIHPRSFSFLEDSCPPELKDLFKKSHEAWPELQQERERILELTRGPKREDIPDNEVTYWRNGRFEEVKRLKAFEKRSRDLGKKVTNMIENITRQEFGIRKIGDAWVSESILYQIICRIFPGEEILRHHHPDWLGGLEIDVYLPRLDLAFEYQGQQHFHAIRAWGGEKALQALKDRDLRKAKFCSERGTRLITIDYTESLTEENIRFILAGQMHKK